MKKLANARMLTCAGLVAAVVACGTGADTVEVKDDKLRAVEKAQISCGEFILLGCPDGLVDGCLTGAATHHACVPLPEVQGDHLGVDCAAELWMICPDRHVDGCLINQSAVHACVPAPLEVDEADGDCADGSRQCPEVQVNGCPPCPTAEGDCTLSRDPGHCATSNLNCAPDPLPDDVGDGGDCALEYVLGCPKGQIDGCILGKTSVHTCIPVD